MKIKVIDQNRTERVIEKTAGKGMILLSELKKRYEDISMSDSELADMTTEFNKSFDSVGSNIKIINGSFSKLKPIECENETTNAVPTSFEPKFTSTPKNEDIESSNPGPSKMEYSYVHNVSEDLNVTFDFEQDVLNEKVSCRKYLDEMTQFVTKTQNVVEDKLIKRTLLLKKISKYQKKIRNMEKSLRRMEKIINFGSELPKLFEDFLKVYKYLLFFCVLIFINI